MCTHSASCCSRCSLDAKPFPAAGRTVAALERAILETAPPVPSSVADAPSRRAATARRSRSHRAHGAQKGIGAAISSPRASSATTSSDIWPGVPSWRDPTRWATAFRKFVRRNRALVASGAAITLLLFGFGATATLQARRISRERDRAERERVAADEVLRILTGLVERGDPNKHPGGDTLRVTSLLDDAEKEVAHLSDDPTRQAALWRAVGGMRMARGEYARGIALLTSAFDATAPALRTGRHRGRADSSRDRDGHG